MLNDKVLLTYKRKRFLCQTDVINDTKLTNLACDISKVSSIDAHEEESKNLYPHHLPTTKVLRKFEAIGKQDMEHMLHSCELLNSTNTIGSILQKPRKLCSSDKICAEGNSSAILEIDSEIGNLVHLTKNIDTEAKQFGSDSSLVGAKISLNRGANGNVDGDESMRLRSKSPLITFSRRRAKSKQVLGERFVGEGSFQDSSFEEKVNCTSTFPGKCVVRTSNEELPHVIPDVNLTPDCTIAEVSARLDLERVETSSEFLMLPTSKESLAILSVVKDKILPLDSEPSNSGNNNFPLTREMSVNKLFTDQNNCEKRRTIDVSDERCSPAGLELSAAPVSGCYISPVAIEQFDDFVPSNCIASERPAASCGPIWLAYEKNNARNELEWLETLDKVSSEKKKGRNACSSNVHDINCREGSSSIMAKKANHSLNYQGSPNDNANLPKSLREKWSFTHSAGPLPEEPQQKEKSTSFTDFLGLYPSSNPDQLIDLNSAPTPPSSIVHLRGSFNMQQNELPCCSSNGNPSLFSIVDMTLSGRHGYISEMSKRYSNQWSEEELDSLWIGVRRHGALNWKTILRDPKLQFVQSRTPEDLSLQWEKEQKKLFNDIFPSAMFSRSNLISSSFLDGHPSAKSHAYAENLMHSAETKLSLGGVYFHKDNIRNTSHFNPLGFGFTLGVPSECSSTCALPGSYLSLSKYPRLPTRQQKVAASSTTLYQTEYGCYKRFNEGSGQAQQQQQQQAPSGTNLPHWLKDVSSSHQIRSDLSWTRFTAGNDTSLANHETTLCFPPSNTAELLAMSTDLRGRGILKRRNAISGKASGAIRIREVSPSITEPTLGTKLGVTPNQNLAFQRPASDLGASHAADLSKNVSASIVLSELVVIDSDLSSEETISDDQSSRP